jgi:hypothetical protein
MKITYKPGKENMADPLSRNPTFLITCLAVTQAGETLKEPTTHAGDFKFDGFMKRIQTAIKHDKWFTNAKNTEALQEFRGVWYKGKQLVVPDHDNLRDFVLEHMHDHPYSGHPGRHRTLQAVQRMFWWPKLVRDIETHVNKCLSCQKTRSGVSALASILCTSRSRS